MPRDRSSYRPYGGAPLEDWILSVVTMMKGLALAAHAHQVVTYREAAQFAPLLDWTNYPRWQAKRTQMSWLLEEVLEECRAADAPPVTVLVVSEENWLPSTGFWDAYHRLFVPGVSAVTDRPALARQLRENCWKYWLKRG